MYCVTHTVCSDINNPRVCRPLDLFYVIAPVYALILCIWHTLFPMLTSAPLDKESLIPCMSPSFEDFKSEVSYIVKKNS